MGFGSGKVSHTKDHVMTIVGANSSKGAMVLYNSKGYVREYRQGSCSKLFSPLGNNGEFWEATTIPLNSIHPIET